jgi:hypothetical protein
MDATPIDLDTAPVQPEAEQPHYLTNRDPGDESDPPEAAERPALAA